MDNEIRKRLRWIQLYEELGNAGVVCLKCGISRPTLRKWWRRYQERGLAGLQEKSRRPKTSPNRKIFPEHVQLIAELRKRKLGHRRIQNELARLHNLSFSTATIHKTLERLNRPLLSHKRAFRKVVTRYSRPIPGDPRADGCLQDRARVISVHRNRRLHALQGFAAIFPQDSKQYIRLSGCSDRGNAVRVSTHSNRPRSRIFRHQISGKASGMAHKIPAHQATITAFEWQG